LPLARFLRLLTGEPFPSKKPVQDCWNDFVSLDRLHSRGPNEYFAAAMMRGPVNCFGGNFRLINWRHRPYAATGFSPTKTAAY
jgi:hypothetical protein